MDIALRVPELVESHKLRPCIDEVSLAKDGEPGEAHFKARCVSDAAAQQSLPKCAPGVTAGSPGAGGDDHGLHLAGGGEGHRPGTSATSTCFMDQNDVLGRSR